MRVLMAMLVGLVQAAGPMLCCCLPARLSAAPAPVESLPAEPTCPHCRTAKPEAPKPGEERRDAPAPHRCPCGGQSLQAATPRVIEQAPEPVPAGSVFPPDWTSLVDERSDRPVALSGVSDLPFLPVQVRLYSHHALRC